MDCRWMWVETQSPPQHSHSQQIQPTHHNQKHPPNHTQNQSLKHKHLSDDANRKSSVSRSKIKPIPSDNLSNHTRRAKTYESKYTPNGKISFQDLCHEDRLHLIELIKSHATSISKQEEMNSIMSELESERKTLLTAILSANEEKDALRAKLRESEELLSAIKAKSTLSTFSKIETACQTSSPPQSPTHFQESAFQITNNIAYSSNKFPPPLPSRISKHDENHINLSSNSTIKPSPSSQSPHAQNNIHQKNTSKQSNTTISNEVLRLLSQCQHDTSIPTDSISLTHLEDWIAIQKAKNVKNSDASIQTGDILSTSFSFIHPAQSHNVDSHVNNDKSHSKSVDISGGIVDVSVMSTGSKHPNHSSREDPMYASRSFLFLNDTSMIKSLYEIVEDLNKI